MTNPPLKPKEFEKSLSELKKLVDKMEQGNLSLEKSLEHFEKGICLIRRCQQTLEQAEQKVQILMQTNKDAELEDFDQAPDK